MRHKEQSIVLNIPNPYYLLTPGGANILIASLNVDLTRVLFFDTNDGGRIIFWDIKSNKMLASLPYIVSTDPAKSDYPPALPFFDGWSPDGKQFVTTSPLRISDTTGEPDVEELFRFDYDGQMTQLTHLSDVYHFVHITEPSWAPDGESIAFWLEVSGSADESIDKLPPQLVVLNSNTGEITDLCLSFGTPFYSAAASAPIWSPDGKYLIVETRMSNGKPRINLVNMEENSLLVLQDGFFPVGWVISP